MNWKLHAWVPDVFTGHRFSIKSLLQLSLLNIDKDVVVLGATCRPVPIKLGDF